MTVTALIAEDEALLAANLQLELAKLWPELEIVASVGGGEAAVQSTLELRPDVLFLDIRMPGMTGLEAAQALAEDWSSDDKPFPLIVFVTAYDQYAVQAFERAAFDYVLKPVQSARLATTCERLKKRLEDRTPTQQSTAWSPEGALDGVVMQMRALLATGIPGLSQCGESTAPLKIIQASVGNTITMIPIEQVVYFEAADKYVRVVTAERDHLIRTSLRELLQRIDPNIFWQIHRGIVVRCDAIASAQRDESGKLTLTLHGQETQLTVSRLYADRFKAM
jgi:DNA-binding LytR/AlgR family response regulator